MSKIPNGVDLAGLQHTFRNEVARETNEYRRANNLPTVEAEQAEAEQRFYSTQLQVRRIDKRGYLATVFGIAAPYDDRSEDLGGYRETIRQGACRCWWRGQPTIRLSIAGERGRQQKRRRQGNSRPSRYRQETA